MEVMPEGHLSSHNDDHLPQTQGLEKDGSERGAPAEQQNMYRLTSKELHQDPVVCGAEAGVTSRGEEKFDQETGAHISSNPFKDLKHQEGTETHHQKERRSHHHHHHQKDSQSKSEPGKYQEGSEQGIPGTVQTGEKEEIDLPGTWKQGDNTQKPVSKGKGKSFSTTLPVGGISLGPHNYLASEQIASGGERKDLRDDKAKHSESHKKDDQTQVKDGSETEERSPMQHLKDVFTFKGKSSEHRRNSRTADDPHSSKIHPHKVEGVHEIKKAESATHHDSSHYNRKMATGGHGKEESNKFKVTKAPNEEDAPMMPTLEPVIISSKNKSSQIKSARSEPLVTEGGGDNRGFQKGTEGQHGSDSETANPQGISVGMKNLGISRTAGEQPYDPLMKDLPPIRNEGRETAKETSEMSGGYNARDFANQSQMNSSAAVAQGQGKAQTSSHPNPGVTHGAYKPKVTTSAVDSDSEHGYDEYRPEVSNAQEMKTTADVPEDGRRRSSLMESAESPDDGTHEKRRSLSMGNGAPFPALRRRWSRKSESHSPKEEAIEDSSEQSHDHGSFGTTIKEVMGSVIGRKNSHGGKRANEPHNATESTRTQPAENKTATDAPPAPPMPPQGVLAPGSQKPRHESDPYSNLGGTTSETADSYAKVMGNLPSLVDPHVPTYGAVAHRKNSTGETNAPEPGFVMQGSHGQRNVSVGSADHPLVSSRGQHEQMPMVRDESTIPRSAQMETMKKVENEELPRGGQVETKPKLALESTMM